MRLADFIDANLEAIIQEWEEFAGRQGPAARGMSSTELRDLCAEILRSISKDMRSHQTETERRYKSRGGDLPQQPDDVTDSARGHAAERLTQGFTFKQLVAEYRALRASVIRRWRSDLESIDENVLEDLTRFNEAIDESQTEAVGWYSARLDDARDLLNGVLAHDLRSPLGAVLAGAEVFLRVDLGNPELTRTAVRVRNSADRMRKMITDLLDFTRTRLGTGMPIALGTCNIGTIVRNVCEEQQTFHGGATIRCKASGNLAGHWDQGRIEQMLANLIGNAVEHGEKSAVTVTASGQDKQVSVSVHNRTGEIPEAQQRVIFDPLRRVALQGDAPGTARSGLGLGLYISRQIAEAHGGTVELRSSSEDGTTFTVRLPRNPAEGSSTAGLT